MQINNNKKQSVYASQLLSFMFLDYLKFELESIKQLYSSSKIVQVALIVKLRIL